MNRLVTLALIVLSFTTNALAWEEEPRIKALFDAAGVEGTFVLYDVASGRVVGHDHDRANRRYVPASTFKIPNTLIGLTTGAVSDVDEVLPYGGKSQVIKAWEKDMALREAITASNVPVYQELARRIGLERMRTRVSDLGYGNADIGDTVDVFWLKGPLAISAVEQTRFLARLVADDLPAPAAVQAEVREIVELERKGDCALYGKTGWANAPEPGIGWWVGWIRNGTKPYIFALNMDIHHASDAPKRIQLGKASLDALGVSCG